MTEYLIKFENIEWEIPGVGIRQKIFTDGKQRLRLLKFADSFVEEEWCTKGHIGFVLEGNMKIDFSGQIRKYCKGDRLWIDGGEVSKHKVIVEKGMEVALILFEIDTGN